jgi:hypothetical protein
MYAREIIGDTFGKTYSGYTFSGSMSNASGMIPLIMYDNGPVQLGITYNGTSGHFLYGNAWGGLGSIVDDRSMLNRAIYWASKCPITTSDSLADLKIFMLSNGDIALSIMNLRNNEIDMPLTLDLSMLGLNQNTTYSATCNSCNLINIDNFSSVKVLLSGSADVLIISNR